ncbi:apolipoprotein N-acyltransferase [Mariprofundus sp. EBB-1]|uniref:apolipoprotein N-acyltransferase n=1 Tax=Mariprofundus sp. EBB-1 TaxID=2650971 RepID=UPI001F420313|nr:apolipoprotein N-acyltransferase [Mariprofundus sp. EBB-1]
MFESKRFYAFVSFLFGALMPFSFSPFDHAWLAIPALTGWLWLIRRGECPLIAGFSFGLGWFACGAWWVAPTLHTYGNIPWIAAAFCVLLLGAVLALFPMLWSWLTWRIAKKGGWLLLVFPAIAVLEEWLRGHLLTGLPWTALGNLLLDTPAIGWASWFGVYGLALIPAMLAASIVLLIPQSGSDPAEKCDNKRNQRIGAVGLSITLLLFALAPTPPVAQGKQHSVALVQGNIPQDQKWDAAFVGETMHRYGSLSAGVAEAVDLIIWPEAAIPFFLERAPGWNQWLNEQMQTWHTPLLYGGLKLMGGNAAQNGLFAHDPAVPEQSFVGKHHLVPFGEYVPAWIPFLHTLVPEIADFKAADDLGVVQVRGISYGSLICYESLFPEEARGRVLAGAEVLVNVTNDAWYAKTPAAWQHFQAARMRAVETGRYVLRAANTGVTAIIEPNGVVSHQLPWWTAAVLQGSFVSSNMITPYVRWGDWPLLIVLMLLLMPAIINRER